MSLFSFGYIDVFMIYIDNFVKLRKMVFLLILQYVVQCVSNLFFFKYLYHK